MKTSLVRLFAAFAWLVAFGQGAFADVTFTVTPSVVSNTYAGTVTLQIGGLTNKTVVIQKFLDLNTNGVIDGGDLLVQQFTLQDGTNFVIGGVTNFNVPGDLNATTGAITATLNFQNGDFVQNIVGNYLYVLSSPGGHFAPITNQFAVTNFPFAQTLTGNVVSNSTSTALPNAIILMFPPPRPGNKGPSGNPLAGVVANNAGSYTVQLPTGTYMPVAFEGNYAANMATAPVLTLAASQTITTNLTLTSATSASISGSVVDANNSSIGLPGVMIPAMSSDGLLVITFTDTNGNFNVPVTAGTWTLQVQDSSLIVHGYVGLNNGTNVSAGATGVTLAVPRATALFYGSVTDNLGNPMAGIDVEAYDTGSNLYGPDGYTDTNGNYFLGIVGGLNDDPWQIQISSDKSPANYIFSQPDLDSNGGTNINSGQAVLANFTAILAINQITGTVKDSNNNPIAGVGVNANATINGTNYQSYVDTDTYGNYSINVANGSWDISINCNGGDDSLDNILGSGNYQCPGNQTAVINNNNATNNFIVQSCDVLSRWRSKRLLRPVPAGLQLQRSYHRVGHFRNTAAGFDREHFIRRNLWHTHHCRHIHLHHSTQRRREHHQRTIFHRHQQRRADHHDFFARRHQFPELQPAVAGDRRRALWRRIALQLVARVRFRQFASQPDLGRQRPAFGHARRQRHVRFHRGSRGQPERHLRSAPGAHDCSLNELAAHHPVLVRRR
jgi:hypothetical protein